MRTKRVLAGVIAVVATTAAAVSGSVSNGTAANAASPPAVPAVVWSNCAGGSTQCARVAVPLDYDQPNGPKTTIALARVPARDKAHRIGTVFVNPGGPGGSGVDLVLGGFGQFLAGALGGRFDVVGFDPRGIGQSSPLRCFANQDQQDQWLFSQPVFPYRSGQFAPFYSSYTELRGRCTARKNPIIDHMSTADVVRDLDLLRAAVGDQRLTYLGFSYGTFIGETYANLFPQHVRALVIDGVLDPRQWASGHQVDSDRSNTQTEFNEFLRNCDAARSQCAFWRPGGASARWKKLVAAVRAHAPQVPGIGRYTYDLLINDAAGAMYSPESWSDAAELFDQVAGAALSEPIRSGAALAHRPFARPQAAAYDNSLEGYFGNQCADTQYPSTLADFERVGRYAEDGSVFGPYWWWFQAACANWPTAPDRFGGPWFATTSKPVLVVGNYFDGVTSYAGAQRVSKLLTNSRLLSYAGWGHTAYGRSACVTQYVDTYLTTLTLPPAKKVCPANPNPFLSSGSSAQRAITTFVSRPPMR